MRHRSVAALALAAVASLGLTACGGSGATSSDGVTLTVGATPSPHAQILNYVNDNLAAAEGIKLDIVEYTDYVQPNTALNDGELDANFYQTVPYLENAEKQAGYDFEAGAGIHLEPLGIFSNKHQVLDELPDGGTIGIISDTSNQSRALQLLATQGLVSIPEGDGDVNINTVTKLKNFDFREVEGPQLVRSLDDFDYAVINGNYAIDAGLNPKKDALVLEKGGKDSEYPNQLVVRKDDKDNEHSNKTFCYRVLSKDGFDRGHNDNATLHYGVRLMVNRDVDEFGKRAPRQLQKDKDEQRLIRRK